MASEWIETKFACICDVTRGASPRPIHDWIVGHGVPWVKISDATSAQSRFISNTDDFIKPEGRSKSVEVFPDDLILSNSATPGIPMFMNIKACIHDGWLLLRNFRGIDKLFAYYLLLYERPALVNKGNGSVFTNLKTDILKNHTIRLPPLDEQRAIAHILGTFDDKIELNRRMNETLEAIARSLWQKMFIEDAEETWKQVSLLDIIDLVGGGTPRTEVKEYWDGSIPWIAAKDITANHRGYILQTEKNITEIGLNNSSAKLLQKFAMVISARGTVGNYCILSSPMAFSQSNYGILPKINESYFFTYLLIAYVVTELKRAAYGTVFDTITTNIFREQKIRIPSENQIILFEDKIKSYFHKIYLNTIQIYTYIALRNVLLPKLISGELRIKDAERFMEKTI